MEYLHKSTYEVLDELIQQLAATQHQQHQRGGSSIVGRRGAIANNTPCGRQDVDVTAFNNYDREMEFLLLDDVIPVDKSIVGHTLIYMMTTRWIWMIHMRMLWITPTLIILRCYLQENRR